MKKHSNPMCHEVQNILDLEERCNLIQEVYWILFLCDIGASMSDFERIIY